MTRRVYTNDTIGNAVLGATAAQMENINNVGARVVTSSSTALSLTATQHSERVVIWSPNAASTNIATLPAATGSGALYEIRNGIAQTQGTINIASASAGDIFMGIAYAFDTTAAADAGAFLSTATSVKVSMNKTTTGGLGYDKLIAIDAALNQWRVEFYFTASGTIATPFSA